MGFIMTNPSHLWLGGTIPYVIGGGIETDALVAIRRWNAAIGHHICFVPRSKEQDYVCIRVTQGISSSYAGRQGGRQDIAINPKWARRLIGVDEKSGAFAGVIVHEMAHAAGLLHEQQRHDRNANIIVHWDLIVSNRCTDFWSAGDTEGKQKKCTITDAQKLRYKNARCTGCYDPDSVMHYLSDHALTNDALKAGKKRTMTPVNGPSSTTGHGSGQSFVPTGSEPFPGQLRGTLSEADTAALRELYPLLNWYGITGKGPSEKHGLLNRSTTRQVRDDLSVRASIRQETPLGLWKYEV